MKLDHLCNVCFTHSAGGIGTFDTLTPDGGMREVQYHCITLYSLNGEQLRSLRRFGLGLLTGE
jgi:hypothetical protein